LENDGRAIYKGSFIEGELSRSVPYSEIKTYITQATVCVFPSFAEALPVSWIEAMAMEKAIVANIGWASDVIDGINGFGSPKNACLCQ
jgi:glycosyltransferase involved in cell wall biosynthesis